MVLQHDIRYLSEDCGNSSSFVTSRFDNEVDQESVVACYESVDISTRSAKRDISNTSRDFDLDNTRQTVNTRESILDLSKEDEEESVYGDDDDEYEHSILFGDLQQYPSSMEVNQQQHSNPSETVPFAVQQPVKSNNVPVAKKSIMDGLTLYSVTDSFVDSLCTSTACVSPNTPSTNATTDKFSHLHPSICTSGSSIGCGSWQIASREQKINPRGSYNGANKRSTSSVSVDVWHFLGCVSSPGEAELEEIWNLRTSDMMMQRSSFHNKKKAPARASIKRRLKRIHGLRMERVSGASRHGVTIANGVRSHPRHDVNCSISSSTAGSTTFDHQHLLPQALEKTYSMVDDPSANAIGHGIDPIPLEEGGFDHDGYDSDPEISFHGPSSQCRSTVYPQPTFMEQHEVMQTESLSMDEIEMKLSAQRTLNSTWTLTWHPNPGNVKEFGVSHKPLCVNIWLERGTVITQSGVVVEPAFMWRDAYQPHLAQHKLNPSTQKPWTMRLLNACRITPCTSMDRNIYPMARQHCSFLLKSCSGEELLLEAHGPDEVVTIAERWKLVVARFASLAVTEDVAAIAKEFFHPTVDSQMLTIPDDDDDMDPDDQDFYS